MIIQKSHINSQRTHSRLATSVGKFYWSAALACSAVIGSILPAEAASFNFTYAPGTTLDQMIGYEMAGQYWSNYLANDVTLNFFIEPTNALPKNVIGGSIPGVVQANWAQVDANFRTAHSSPGTASVNQQIALNNEYSQFNLDSLANTYSTLLGTQSTSITGVNTINLTRANAKALGIINGNDPGLDGYILVSNLENLTKPLSWHYYSPGDSVPSGTLDYFSMALHELGHNLGFLSGTDAPNWSKLLTSQTFISGLTMNYTYLLDLFRFSSKSTSNSSVLNLLNLLGDNSKNDMSIGGDPFFSIDGGKTRLADFSSGVRRDLGGDGYQGSHWEQQSSILGIMDPTLGIGQRRQISTLDQTAMNVLGWNLQQGDTNLTNVYNSAETRLAQKMGVTVNWMNANPSNGASLVTPNWIDTNKNNLDDRGESLNKMLASSGVYQWTANSYSWGANGYWWGWTGYWQTANVSANGFWQNVAAETLDEEEPLDEGEPTSSEAISVSEPSSMTGLIGMALVGIASLLQRRRQKQG
ncbi:MAG: NF038122 family metalloprotease [Stigonema ocellatum SAG 48.90 = DSM 106950]|nr:NF038122 family metalloprotease [Stigonema ocellatum SAG 48.90 = DSM 106950]